MAELRGRQSFAGLMQRMVAQAEAEGVQRATRRAVARVRAMRSGRATRRAAFGGVLRRLVAVGSRTPAGRRTIRSSVRGRDPAAGAMVARRRRSKSAPQAEKILSPNARNNSQTRPEMVLLINADKPRIVPSSFPNLKHGHGLPPAPAARAIAPAMPVASMTCFWHVRHVVCAPIEVMPHTSCDVTCACRLHGGKPARERIRPPRSGGLW